MFRSMIVVSSCWAFRPISQTSPHRVIEERILSILNDSGLLRRYLSSHHSMQPACADNSILKRIHIEIADKYGSRMPCPSFGQLNLF